jgi:hypothetical protein
VHDFVRLFSSTNFKDLVVMLSDSCKCIQAEL